MSALEGTTLIVYLDVAEILDRSNDNCEGLGPIALHVVQPDRVEKVGSLVPRVALDVVLASQHNPCSYLMVQPLVCMPLNTFGML